LRKTLNAYGRRILRQPDVESPNARSTCWQGTDDQLVAASINKTVADRMPGAVWRPVEGAGHFVAVGSADEVFASTGAELGA
jgi:pimeloyl-ACP methyl ester carboxylesterase